MNTEEMERRSKQVKEWVDDFAKRHGWTKRKPMTHCPCCGHELKK